MPHLTVNFSPNGPLLDVLIGVSTPRREALTKAGQSVPAPIPARLLIDTGASHTAIDPNVLGQLSLSSTGATPMHTPSTTAGKPVDMDQFDISLAIPTPALSRTFHALPVAQCHFKHQGFDGLLGRDILSDCLLIYTGPDNAFMLSI